jgi:hypothetical protein
MTTPALAHEIARARIDELHRERVLSSPQLQRLWPWQQRT